MVLSSHQNREKGKGKRQIRLRRDYFLFNISFNKVAQEII